MEMTPAKPPGGLDWSAIKPRVDLAAVVAGLLGSPARRAAGALLWRCPFHDDSDPSFRVEPGRRTGGTWRCWTCAIGGDAADLVMRLERCDFRTAARRLADL